MRNFVVTVNGVQYQVAVEEVVSGSAPAVAPAPVVAPAPAVSTPAAAPAAQGTAGATAIKAPMPGTILKINVAAGSAVKKGDVLCVLEAMKMENDICAPADGVIASVSTSKGVSVATDDVLMTMN